MMLVRRRFVDRFRIRERRLLVFGAKRGFFDSPHNLEVAGSNPVPAISVGRNVSQSPANPGNAGFFMRGCLVLWLDAAQCVHLLRRILRRFCFAPHRSGEMFIRRH